MLSRAGKVCLLSLAVVLSSLLVACGGDDSAAPPPAVTLSKLTISPAVASLPNGTTQQLTVTGTYSDGTSKNVTPLVAWTVSPATAAKVSSSGLLTALAQGTATVNATITAVSAHLPLTVQAPALTSIQITPSSVSIPLGTNQQLTATASYTDGTSANVTNSVSWSSTPATVASVNVSGLVQSVSKGSFSITATSGTISGSLNATVGNAALQSLQVLPTSAAIPKGTTQIFSATAIFTDGSKQDVTASATWQSSNIGVASVSSTGTATSSAQGSADISASYQTVGATAALTVSAASIKSIQVSPATASLAKGTNLQLDASAVLTDGSTQDVTNSVVWSSSASSVCSVSASAMATAVNTGTCMATATSGSVSASATLTVTAATLTGITLTPPNPSVCSGGSVQLKATGNFSDGSSQDMTGSVIYTSSKPLVAIATPTGLLQGLTTGNATVTATSGSVSASLSVTVTAATLQSLTLGTGSLTVAAGISSQLSAIGSYSDGSTQDLSSTVTWSTSASSIAAVNATGDVTGLAVGTATINATLGSISGSASVTVTQATVVSITVNPLSVTIAAGQSQAFTATATLTDGTTSDVTASVHWSISNPVLATISNSLGNAGALAALVPGTGTVSASLGSVTGTATLYVNAASLVGISVGPTGLSLALGVPAQLTATGTYSDGSTQDITASVAWSTSNGQSLTVSAAGLVTPLSIGSATVTASMNGQSGGVSVSITSAILNSINITTSGGSLALGLSQQFSATGTYSDGSTQDITAVVHWSSSNTSIATISAAGLVLAVGGGTASINATLGSVTQSSSLTVSAAILESINVTAAQNSFALGFTLQLTATGTYSDGSTQDLTSAAIWTSNNPAIALIGSTGLVSGLATGGIAATATLQGVSGSLNVTVNAATLVSITVSPASVNLLQLLLTQQFAVVGHFSDGSTQTLNTGVHWSCTNGLLATINSTGLLTALGLGNLNVTATYGSLTATAAVSIL
jgi:trimeric autotransporter adhesin